MAELAGYLWQLGARVFAVAAAEAGKPGQECRGGQKEPLHPCVPLFLYGVVVVRQGTAILVDSDTYVVEEVEAVVGELGLGREEMSEGAEGEVGEGCQEDDEEGLSVRVSQEIHRLRDLLPLHQDDEGRQQVGPHVEGLIVPLEEGEEVVAPALVRLSVAGEDVALAEHPGNVGHLHSARQRGEGRLQQLGDLTQLLRVDEQAADLLHHHRRHGKLEAREEGGKE